MSLVYQKDLGSQEKVKKQNLTLLENKGHIKKLLKRGEILPIKEKAVFNVLLTNLLKKENNSQYSDCFEESVLLCWDIYKKKDSRPPPSKSEARVISYMSLVYQKDLGSQEKVKKQNLTLLENKRHIKKLLKRGEILCNKGDRYV